MTQSLSKFGFKALDTKYQSVKKDYMDISRNAEPGIKSTDPRQLIFIFEKKINSLELEQVKLEYKRLSYLCHNFDPYDVGEIDNTEVRNILNVTGLGEFLANPFEFTNILLQLLDKTENRIKSLEH